MIGVVAKAIDERTEIHDVDVVEEVRLVYIFIYIHTHTYTYIYTHTYTHTHTQEVFT